MAHKIARGKGIGKGIQKTVASLSPSESVFDFVDKENMEFFDEKCQGRHVIKQNYYKTRIVDDLHIPKVVSRLNHQEIIYFMQLT